MSAVGGRVAASGASGAVPLPGSRVLRLGSLPAADVEWLQGRLGVPADGLFGPRTQAAVVAFQSEYGLLTDGVVGPATWRALGVSLPAAEPVFVPPRLPDGSARWAALVERVLRQENCFDPAGWAPVLVARMATHDIRPGLRASTYLANIIHETGGLRALVENLHYTTPERLVANWPGRFPTVEAAIPFLANGPKLAERVYGGRYGNVNPGDGYKYRGHGNIQVTFFDNFNLLSQITGIPIDRLLEMMKERAGATEVSCLWWKASGINELADRAGAEVVRRRVNGGEIGMKHVMEIHGRVAPPILEFAGR